MRQSIPMFRTVLAVVMVVFCCCAMAAAGERKDACSLLTKAEIQAAIGQNVGDGALNTKANPAVGQPCQYVAGTYGAFSILNKTTGPGETADNTIAALNNGKIVTTDVAGLGDRSFFSSPGYGMIQLNTFQGTNYLIITIMIPGTAEAAQKSAAVTLMHKALARL